MRHSLLDPFEGKLMVACSGGADSLALAHLAIERARLRGLSRPIIAHVDHGLRPDSEAEGEAVRVFAESQGAPAMVRRVHVPADRGSLEAAAREARYGALDALAAETGSQWVLLAHTQSDQAETVLMRIVRGTGLVGLSGMHPTRGRYARPLLGITRRDTEAYCALHDLVFSHDPMNRDHRYARVRFRHQWLPDLEGENPQLRRALCGLADAARDHREVLDWAAQRWLEQRRCGDGRISLAGGLDDVPRSVVTRALSIFVEEQGGGPLERKHQEAAHELCMSMAGSQERSLPGGILVRNYEELCWNPGAEDSFAVEVGSGLIARRWQRGDRMRPARLKGRSRKLSDLFADARVPARDRLRAWVVCRDRGEQAGEIVWAQHVGYAFETEAQVILLRNGEQLPE